MEVMNLEEKFIRYLVLQTVNTKECGLFHGKIGMVLCLYLYGVSHGDSSLCEYAKAMLQSIPIAYVKGDVGLENGLSGVGLGYTLLKRSGMFSDSLESLLSEVDDGIMRVDPRRMDDFSFRTGASGIQYYIRMRASVGEPFPGGRYADELARTMRIRPELTEPDKTLLCSLKKPVWSMDDYLGNDPGIDGGTAYYIMHDSYDKVFPR